MSQVIALPTLQATVADAKSMAKAIFGMDEYRAEIIRPGVALVSRNGAAYQVTAEGICTCKHFTNRLAGTGARCKHYYRAEALLKSDAEANKVARSARAIADRSLLW